MRYYEDFSNDEFDEEQEELLNDRTWKSSNGDLIEVSKMTDSHIENTINILEARNNYNPYKDEWLEIFHDEQRDRKNKILKMFD